MEYQIFMCDDDPAQITNLDFWLNRVSFDLDLEIKRTSFSNSKEALHYLTRHSESIKNIQVFLLDIEMPDIDGITLAKFIRSHDPDAVIVYITGFRSYAVDAFEVRAFNYLMKPLTYEAFMPVIKDSLKIAFERKLKVNSEKYYVLDRKEAHIRLNYNDILYFEKFIHRIKVVTQKDSHEFYGSLKTLKEQLDMEVFVQCHQSFIVNMTKVEGYKGQEITLNNGKFSLPVSKASVKVVKERLGNQFFK